MDEARRFFKRVITSSLLKSNMTRLLIQLIMSFVPSMLFAASFDCAKSTIEIERIICGDTHLSELDDQLSEVYHRVLRQAGNPSEVKEEQIQWLKDVRDKCPTAYSVANAYRKRIRDLTLDCSAPKNQFEKLACSASDKDQLEKLFQGVLNEWKPYLEQRYKSSKQQQALSWWHNETEPLFVNWTKGCMTFACRRARIATAMERWSFPKEAYEALQTWIKKTGDQSPLLTSNQWKISSADAVAAWDVSADKIYMIGEMPKWLTTKEDDASSIGPPFLRRNLSHSEAYNLGKMVTTILPWSWWDKVTVAGVTAGMRKSVVFHDGGGAKCSPNQLISAISVSDRFPDLPDALGRGDGKSFKIIEIREDAIDQHMPSCALDDPNPEGFFQDGQESYRSRIVIDDVHGLFIRPDGTFWLKLSDDNWYRFRRDMTSGAAEIGSKYNILSYLEFETILDKSKNIEQFDAHIVSYIENRKHGK